MTPHFVITFLITLILLWPVSGFSTPDSKTTTSKPKIHIVYGVLNTLQGVNYDDARVALEMNFDRQSNVTYPDTVETRLEILPDVSAAMNLIRQKKLHGLSVTAVDYLRLKESAPIKPLFVASSLFDTPLEPFLLLTKKGVTLEQLKKKGNARLIVEGDNRWDISKLWLETVLHDEGYSGISQLFSETEHAYKPIKLILPVFFGQADACLVPQSAFTTMVELNPQLGRQLKIVHQSPGFIKSMICIIDHVDQYFVTKMKENISKMHTTVDGKQLLTIFRIRRNYEFRPEYLKTTEEVLMRYQRIHPNTVVYIKSDSPKRDNTEKAL